MSEEKEIWKDQKSGFNDALIYLNGRRLGNIKSILTPWYKFNEASTNGIEWNSTTVIGGRPAAGKTLIKDQIIREAFKLNPDQTFRVLEFQFEMLARTSAIREFSSHIGQSYKFLCSAEIGKTVTKEQIAICHAYAKEKMKYPIDTVDIPVTVADFIKIIQRYMEKYVTIVNGVKEYTSTIITLDHTILLKKGPGEKDKMDTLYALGEALTYLKKMYPIAFIILSQLNRDIDRPERSEDGKYGNFILESDFFGADAMNQHADILIGINKPSKHKIRYYGPERFIIEPETLVLHFLKCRNGETSMAFFKTEFQKMRIVEIPKPATQERKIKM